MRGSSGAILDSTENIEEAKNAAAKPSSWSYVERRSAFSLGCQEASRNRAPSKSFLASGRQTGGRGQSRGVLLLLLILISAGEERERLRLRLRLGLGVRVIVWFQKGGSRC